MSQTESDAAHRFDVKRITDFSAWNAISAQWDGVLRATPGYTPLQSFDFLATWWQHMAGDRVLWILAFHDEQGRIAGIAPLQISTRRILSKRYRVLEFIGMTEDILVPTMLFPERDRSQLYTALVDYLSQHRSAWDLIELDELATNDPVFGRLGEYSQGLGLIYREQPFHDCPFIQLTDETVASFRNGRSRKLLKNLRASERKLQASGATSIEIHRSAAEIVVGFQQLLEVERLSWKRQAQVGMSSDPRYETFYGRLLEVFARDHGARVLVLKCGDRPIAATMAILFDHIYCSLQIFHDERYARFSPGTLLELHEMEDLLRSGSARRYEFLGGALTNKLRWTESAVSTRCLRVRKPEIRTRLLDLYEFRAKPIAKRILRRAGFFKPSPQRGTAS